jgi:dihydroorotate dehydrogenase (fumarate)
MEKKGLNTIEDIHKLGRTMIPNHAEVFERVQFMKYFGEHGKG